MRWQDEWTATAIAAAVSSGAAEPDEPTAEALGRIRERDSVIGAFRTVRPLSLTEALSAPRGPLAGVPIAVKDCIPVAGEPMRVGSQATAPTPSAHDHPVVSRLRAAGAIPIGITNVPEMCTFGTTDSAAGITRNPWNPDLTAGGSSGGSAAAVAAGMVPVAHAADGMGSIRIPGACTGLVGIKPGTGVVPAELGVNDWFGLSENGVLATTVADAALVLSVMADREDLADVAVPARCLNVGLSYRPPVPGVRLDPAWAAAAGRAAALLAGEGHLVERIEIGMADSSTGIAAVSALSRWFAGVAVDTADLDDDLLEPRVRTHARLGRLVQRTPALGDRLRDSWRRAAMDLLGGRDVLITPALASPPPEAREWHRVSWAANMVANIRYAPYAAPWNLAGYPAMVVPMGLHPDTGTPVAAQLVGVPGSEGLLLSIARLLEVLHPWQRTAR